ncbi:MAG: hypothetical protein L6R37_008180 [Teloschistes peruensis]|nr:MAG: hypothetical protein L6R37_008180 [Teloschistes peruensis]
MEFSHRHSLVDWNHEKRRRVRTVQTGKMNPIMEAKPDFTPNNKERKTRDVKRGVFELARLHTREAWLCWYPAGHDICDTRFDARVERCKTRPLPAGMLSYSEAIITFIAWIPIVLATTNYTLGENGLITFAPVWLLSLTYPFMKRLIPFPQLVLGAIIGAAVFPGWSAITGSLHGLGQAVPLFAATFSWVVYFDVFYAVQDREDDAKIGVKSLAVLLGNKAWIFLSLLGLLQVASFAITAVKANMSWIFWIFGIGVWAANIPWHVLSLDMTNRKSGGKIFKANIMLGLYMTGIAMTELVVTRVDLHALLHVVGQATRSMGTAK